MLRPEKRPRFRLISFALHAARGLVRNQSTRRWTMFVILIAAMFLVFCGTTLLESLLSPREHPACFILYWIACGWLTLTAFLLAIFDLLIVRLEGRSGRRRLRRKLEHEHE